MASNSVGAGRGGGDCAGMARNGGRLQRFVPSVRQQIWTGPRRPAGQSFQIDVGSPLCVRASHIGQRVLRPSRSA